MENEFAGMIGFSKIPEDSGFKKDMKNYVNKKYKFAFVVLPILYIIIYQITAIITGIKDEINYARMLIPGLVLLGIFVLVALVILIVYLLSVKKLEKGAKDGMVIKIKKQYKEDDSIKKCILILETEDGKKIKVKGKKAITVCPYISEGDKVRYHYGYPFPVEIYNKDASGVNVCPFCGFENELKSFKCAHCNNMLLK
ncbi:MAG: hypothetical protein J5590_03505 [Clostridia bacterium]|nr:hypothetical protein [Clostridia bacterium]